MVVIVSLFAGGLYLYYHLDLARQILEIPEIPTDQLLTEGEIAQNKVWYIINTGKDIRKYQIETLVDSTVFSLLKELAIRENFEIETTLYPEMGIFVESINGFKGGSDNKWWQYWVNSRLGEVAADKKKIKGGDIIEWKFEVPPEF